MSEGIKLSELLPERIADLGDSIEHGLREEGAKGPSRLAWGFIRSTAADELYRSMDYDVFNLLALAWSKANVLRGFARTEPEDAGKVRIVHLGEHDMKTSVEHVLELGLGFPPNLRLPFKVEVAAKFDSAALSIRDGRITSIAPGEAHVTAQLFYRDTPLHKKAESRKLKLPGRIDLKPPGLAIG